MKWCDALMYFLLFSSVFSAVAAMWVHRNVCSKTTEECIEAIKDGTCKKLRREPCF
jgi:hypothetical protein